MAESVLQSKDGAFGLMAIDQEIEPLMVIGKYRLNKLREMLEVVSMFMEDEEVDLCLSTPQEEGNDYLCIKPAHVKGDKWFVLAGVISKHE